MKGWQKTIVGAVLSFSVLTGGIGYAAVSDSLEARGTVKVEPPVGIFIYDVAVADGVDAEIGGYTGTVVNSTVTLTTVASSKVSFDISLYNNSQYEYTFNGVKYLEEAYSNSDITFALTGLAKGDEMTGNQRKTFTITFSYKNGKVANSNVLDSVLNFEFVPKAEYIPEIVVTDALGKFKEILNSEADYNALITQMEDTSGRANDSYIGNVVGSTAKDTEVLETLFTEGTKTYLTLVIGDKETNITAMIKREDLDGNAATGDENGKEMTIYMTADTITSSWFGSSKVSVFAAVFTKKSGSDWYQIGEMYSGEATTNNYSGFGRANSFNTDTWKSTTNYYSLGTGKTIETLITTYLNRQSS